MYSLHRPTLRECMRAVAVCIVIAFVFSAVSIAYAAGRHSGHGEADRGRSPVSSQSHLRAVS
jgi:hypothetical protein